MEHLQGACEGGDWDLIYVREEDGCVDGEEGEGEGEDRMSQASRGRDDIGRIRGTVPGDIGGWDLSHWVYWISLSFLYLCLFGHFMLCEWKIVILTLSL